jgi:pyroglutamyl-peptidase
MERVGHKFGYNMKDATGCLAPIVRVAREDNSNPNHGQSEPSAMERMERARLSGYDIEAPVDGTEPPKRGFGKGYETFPEEIHTDIDVEKLVHHLKRSGIDVRVICMYLLVMISNMVSEANIFLVGCRTLPL